MTNEELAEIEARAANASPGPWTWVADAEREVDVMPILLSGPPGDGCFVVCDFGNSEQYYPTEGEAPSDADADFIAHARQDVDSLAAEVRRLQHNLRQWEENCQHFWAGNEDGSLRCVDCGKISEGL